MGQRYPTDLTDTEWTILAPLIPGSRTCWLRILLRDLSPSV